MFFYYLCTMHKTALDEQLMATQQLKERGWAKIISTLKRQFDVWATENLICKGHEEMKLWYLPLIMNIGPDGITNNELAKKSHMTKQAMSKIVKELLQLGYIETCTCDDDKRCSNIFLTEKGKMFALSCRQSVLNIETIYTNLLGKEKFENVKEVLLEIIAFNAEGLCCKKSQDIMPLCKGEDH